MDLDQMRNTKAEYDQLDPEDKAEADSYGVVAKGYMAKAFPAIPETDQAAFAWFMSASLRGLAEIPVARISEMLEDSAKGYAVAAINLLGWNDL